MWLLSAAKQTYNDRGVWGLVEGASSISKRKARTHLLNPLSRLHLPGVPIYEREWDVLVVLDACRIDIIKDVNEEYPFIDNMVEINSVGTKTTEWMERTFTEEYVEKMNDTVYVAGNPNTARYLNQSQFAFLDEVWRYAWDEQLGTLPARPLTDRAIAVSRNRNPEWLIVHYMQPHEPFVQNPELGGRSSSERIAGIAGESEEFESVWTRLQNGEIEKRALMDAYRSNLRYVLDDVALLLRSIDAEQVVISSDHGNAIGEFGQYGHPPYTPLKCLKRVPWIETEANNKSGYEPTTERADATTVDVEEKLKHLGYR